MGKRGPPYKPPDDAQFIVVLRPPHIIQTDGQIDYSPLEYWLRALFGDQRGAKFIYEIERQPDVAVIVELPSPDDLPFPKPAYGEHSLRLGLKRRPWFIHNTGKTVIFPYNFEIVGHPEDTRKLRPMISGACEDEWSKFDLTIPYPTPQPFDFSSIPQRVKMFCRRPPDVTPPPPDPMEIERSPTPPARERQRTRSSPPRLQPEDNNPLFLPEDDSKPKIKNLDPYQEEESISSFLRGSSDAINASRSGVKGEPRLDSVEGSTPRNPNRTHRESNALPPRANDEHGNPLMVKREFANQDDTVSQRMYELLDTVNRSQSPPEDDRLTVKRELENQDGASAQKMYEVLDAVNRGQSTHAEGSISGRVKRDLIGGDMEPKKTPPPPSNQTRSFPQAPQRPTPNRDRDRDSKNNYSSSSSLRDRDERGGREWRGDGERGRDPAGGRDRKRSFGYQDERGRVEGRGPDDRDRREREYPDKRSRANYR